MCFSGDDLIWQTPVSRIGKCKWAPHDKTKKMTVRPAKTQISLDIRPVWSESSLCAQWLAKDPSFLHADSEDSDQTGRMPRLIWVFAWRKVIVLFVTWGGSNNNKTTLMILWELFYFSTMNFVAVIILFHVNIYSDKPNRTNHTCGRFDKQV